MPWLHDLSYVLGGTCLINAVPHLVAGVMGEPFQSPFAKPPGVGLSSATVNVFWGVANLVFAYLLLYRVGVFDLRSPVDAAAAGLGILLMGLVLARSFGCLHGGDAPGAS